MIKLETLSLGNFVYHKKKKKIVKIIEIKEYGVKTIWKDDVYGSDNLIADAEFHTDIEGVPISILNMKELFNVYFEKDDDENLGLFREDEDFYDEKTHTLRLTKTNTSNRGNDNDFAPWFVHVDNWCFDTIGTANVIYIHELQNFLNSIGYDINLIENK